MKPPGFKIIMSSNLNHSPKTPLLNTTVELSFCPLNASQWSYFSTHEALGCTHSISKLEWQSLNTYRFSWRTQQVKRYGKGSLIWIFVLTM
jgi:hypothetical protein